MDFDLQWLLIGLPVAFALGWLASRLDSGQLKRESPKAYFKGLSLLLNEQPDKAIDAFIEAVQHDPDTSELHFALGSLFRRRGEFERAVRVHQHLMARADLPPSDRERAQHELAEDFMKAGLFDRAEQAYRALAGTPFETESRLTLLSLYERAHDWPSAAETAAALERSGAGSFATRIAHHWCERALEADARLAPEVAEQALAHARAAAPQAPRPLLMLGQRLARAGRHAEAMDAWTELRLRDPAAFQLAASDYAASAVACGRVAAASELLRIAYAESPGLDLLRAQAVLQGGEPGSMGALWSELLHHLRTQPTLSAAQAVLGTASTTVPPGALDGVRTAVDRAAKPLQRYRCAACGFEAQRHFWWCPGCLSWDSFPPRRIEEQ